MSIERKDPADPASRPPRQADEPSGWVAPTVRLVLDLVTAGVMWVLLASVVLNAVGVVGFAVLACFWLLIAANLAAALWLLCVSARDAVTPTPPLRRTYLAALATAGPIVAIPLALASSSATGSTVLRICSAIAALNLVLATVSAVLGRWRGVRHAAGVWLFEGSEVVLK